MEALLASYSIEEILLFLVLLFGAIKEGAGAIDWLKEKYNIKFNKDYKEIDKEKELNNLNEKIDNLIIMFTERLEKLEQKIDVLTQSDKDDIKSWLVEKYTYYKENPSLPISQHTMDTIEKRYSHYKEEGGNSYIDEIIIPGLRAMAKEESRVSIK